MDAACGCEHASGDECATDEYVRKYTPDGAVIDADTKEVFCPPLSKATPRPITKEQAAQHLANVRAEAAAKIKEAEELVRKHGDVK